MKYTSISSGKEVEIVKINYYKVYAIQQAVEDELRAEGWQVDKPTYEVKVGTGEETQSFEHRHILDDEGNVTDSTLETEEDFAAWDKYEEARQEVYLRYMRRTANFALQTGVKIDMDADNGWESDQEYYGIQIPTDPRDKYLHYLETEVFPDIQERRTVAVEIINMSAPDIESTKMQESVQEFFRGQVEEEQG